MRYARVTSWLLSAVLVCAAGLLPGQVSAQGGTCADLVDLTPASSWPVSCPSCAEGVTLATSLRLVAQGFDGGRRQSFWVALGDVRLVSGLEGRFHRCAPLAWRALEQGLVGIGAAADPALERARKRLLALIAKKLPYRLRRGHRLTPEVELRLAALTARARRYGARRRFLVTSGTRDPYRQARAMFIKLVLGARLVRLYRNKKAVRAIVRAFRRGRRAGVPHYEVVAAMQRVIEGQVCRGKYISEHLKAGAVDLRSIGVSRRDRRALRRAVYRMRRLVYYKRERRPPHFHLAFRRLRQRTQRPAYCAPQSRPVAAGGEGASSGGEAAP